MSEHQRNLRKSKKEEKKKKTPYKIFKTKGGLCRYYVEQRDPRHGGRPFCPPFLVSKTPASMTLSSKEQIRTALIKGGAAGRPPEARLKGPERLIRIRKPDHLRLAHTLILSATPPF